MTKALALLLISIVSQANGFFFGGYRPLFYGGYGGFGGFGGYGLGGFGRYGGFGFGGHGRYKRSLGDYDSQSHSAPERNVHMSGDGHLARVVKHDYSHHDAHHDLAPVRQVLSRPVLVERVHSRPAVAESHHDGYNYGALVHARPASVGLSHTTPVHHVVDLDYSHHDAHHDLVPVRQVLSRPVVVERAHSRPAVVESHYDGHDYGALHARPASVGLAHRTPVHHFVKHDYLHHDAHDLVPVRQVLSSPVVVERGHSRPAVVESHYDEHDDGALVDARPASVGLSSHRTPVHVVPVIIDRDHAFNLHVSNVHASDHGTGWGHERSYPTNPATYIGVKSLSTIHSDHDSYHGTPVRRLHMRPVTLVSASHKAPVHRVVRPVSTDSHDHHEHMY